MGVRKPKWENEAPAELGPEVRFGGSLNLPILDAGASTSGWIELGGFWRRQLGRDRKMNWTAVAGLDQPRIC
jgi:hypothetical protein